jgi:site-specific recombinase XerD
MKEGKMLTKYFNDRKTLEKLRSGPAGPHLDGFAIQLECNGYSRQTARRHIRGAGHFSAWAEANGSTINALDETGLVAFSRYLSSHERLKYKTGRYTSTFIGARHFVTFLKISGVVSSLPLSSSTITRPPIVSDFCHWMRNHRGVMESTLNTYCPIVVDLVNVLGDQPEGFEAKKLREFVMDRASRHGISKAKTIVTSVRMFLRFLIAIGKCAPGLDHAIPTIAEWRLSSLPQYLSSEDIERIIEACVPSTPLGVRDRAVILPMARLGLRAGDVAGLKLDDIDWREGTLLVSGKNRRETLLPLPQDVGDAILHYLEYIRPHVNSNKIFITIRAPFVPVSRYVITQTAVRAMQRIPIDAPSHGAHVFRHSVATAMLQQGATLQEIGALLRHSSIETTAHYAKVDVNLLEEIAMPWPEVNPC